jgi:hypothetical protein
MTGIPAARFEDTATKRGSRSILDRVGAFVEAYGVASPGRGEIEHTLDAILGVAAGHASPRADARIAVVADVMPSDVQLVLRLWVGDPSPWEEGDAQVGGLELWISFPRG